MTLPQGWAKTTLGDIAEFVMGQAPPGTDCNTTGDGTPFVKAGEFGPSRPALREWTTKPLKMAQHDDVLICVVGATAGKLNLGADCAIGRSVAAIRPSAATSASFIYPRLQSEVSRLRAGSTGTAQGVISKEMLSEIDLSLPPAAEQRRIVARLDALTARLAHARAELDWVPVLAAKLRAAAVEYAFVGKATYRFRTEHTLQAASDDDLATAYEEAVGRQRRKPTQAIDWQPGIDIPSRWRWVSVDQVIARAQYGSSAKTDERVGVPVLRMGNIQDGKLDFCSLKYLPPEHDEFPDLLLQAGDVIFNRTNSVELVGKSAVFAGFDEPVSFASYLIRVQCCAIRPKLLAYYLNSAIRRDWVSAVASQQVGQANVNGTKLKGLALPLPPQAEQIEMEAWIDNAFSRADRLEAEAARARALISRLEAAILARAFRGELVPQDPTDEPASVLLEQARLGRAAEPKAKRGRKKLSV